MARLATTGLVAALAAMLAALVLSQPAAAAPATYSLDVCDAETWEQCEEIVTLPPVDDAGLLGVGPVGVPGAIANACALASGLGGGEEIRIDDETSLVACRDRFHSMQVVELVSRDYRVEYEEGCSFFGAASCFGTLRLDDKRIVLRRSEPGPHGG